MLLIAVFVCAVTAFGVEVAKEVLPEEAVQIIEQIEDMSIAPISVPLPEDIHTAYRNTVIGTDAKKHTTRIIPCLKKFLTLEIFYKIC